MDNRRDSSAVHVKKYIGKTHEPDLTRNQPRGFRPRLGHAFSRVTLPFFSVKTKDVLGPVLGL